jgi:hypothetical protein
LVEEGEIRLMGWGGGGGRGEGEDLGGVDEDGDYAYGVEVV